STGRSEGELSDAGARLNLPTFSADGRRLVTMCSDCQTVRVWDLATRRVVHTINPNVSVAGLAVRPDGEEVAVFASQCPTLWPVGPGPGRPLCGGGGLSGRFSPDGAVLAVANRYGVVELFDAKMGQLSRPAVTDAQAGPGEILTPAVPMGF